MQDVGTFIDREWERFQMKRMFRLAAFAAVGLLVSSCMDLTTEIHVKKDGSATVSQAIYMTSALAAMQQLGDSKSLDR